MCPLYFCTTIRRSIYNPTNLLLKQFLFHQRISPFFFSKDLQVNPHVAVLHCLGKCMSFTLLTLFHHFSALVLSSSPFHYYMRALYTTCEYTEKVGERAMLFKSAKRFNKLNIHAWCTTTVLYLTLPARVCVCLHEPLTFFPFNFLLWLRKLCIFRKKLKIILSVGKGVKARICEFCSNSLLLKVNHEIDNQYQNTLSYSISQI